jgi:putative oxidoreductase
MISAAFLDKWSPRVLGVLRIVAALMFMEHGTSKLLHFPDAKSFEGVQVLSLIGFAGILELGGGLLLALGLFTRPVAFILSGEMAVAYFMVHAQGSFFPILNHGELAVLYCFVFLYFAAAGGGTWSLDQLRHKR